MGQFCSKMTIVAHLSSAMLDGGVLDDPLKLIGKAKAMTNRPIRVG
jgi:hypothetical protein